MSAYLRVWREAHGDRWASPRGWVASALSGVEPALAVLPRHPPHRRRLPTVWVDDRGPLAGRHGAHSSGYWAPSSASEPLAVVSPAAYGLSSFSAPPPWSYPVAHGHASSALSLVVPESLGDVLAAALFFGPVRHELKADRAWCGAVWQWLLAAPPPPRWTPPSRP